MALMWPSRAADLAKLNLNTHSYTGKGVSFQPSHLSKQCHLSKPITEFFFPHYLHDESLCRVQVLQAYERSTEPFRAKNSSPTLFLSWIEKYEPVSSSTITRWLRTCLEEAGIDVNTFTHSVRGAACSCAAWSGVTVADILNAADWSTETTFQQFYHQAIQDISHHLELLSGRRLVLQTYMLIWRRSLPKCNLQMAQGTQCLHAIGNYMRKVNL